MDVDLTRLDGGGGLNPNFLVRDPKNGCRTILPHQYLRVNTIFEVVKAGGGRTAWTDKRENLTSSNSPGQMVRELKVQGLLDSTPSVAAATIIKALGLDLDDLVAVRNEQIHVLPWLLGGEVNYNVT